MTEGRNRKDRKKGLMLAVIMSCDSITTKGKLHCDAKMGNKLLRSRFIRGSAKKAVMIKEVKYVPAYI